MSNSHFPVWTLTCPKCIGRFGVDAGLLGKIVTCPHCQETIATPSLSQLQDSFTGTREEKGPAEKIDSAEPKPEIAPAETVAPAVDHSESPAISNLLPASQVDESNLLPPSIPEGLASNSSQDHRPESSQPSPVTEQEPTPSSALPPASSEPETITAQVIDNQSDLLPPSANVEYQPALQEVPIPALGNDEEALASKTGKPKTDQDESSTPSLFDSTSSKSHEASLARIRKNDAKKLRDLIVYSVCIFCSPQP